MAAPPSTSGEPAASLKDESFSKRFPRAPSSPSAAFSKRVSFSSVVDDTPPMASAKGWPDPPLWLTFNADSATDDAPSGTSPANSTTSLPPLRPARLPLPRMPTQVAVSVPGKKSASARFRDSARRELTNSARKPPSLDNACLSTSSLSEPPSKRKDRAAQHAALQEKADALASIDVSQLVVDFADPSQELGRGTFGSVHCGQYFGNPVAVKRVLISPIPLQLRKNKQVSKRRREALTQFARQIRRFEAVQHPSIVRFLGVCLPYDDSTQSSVLLVTELMYGGTLAAGIDAVRNANKALDMPSLARIAVQVCGGIRALHQNGYAWGDAKTENVLLSERIDPSTGEFSSGARACISDLGISDSATKNLHSESTIGSSTASQSNMYVYMSPEAFEDAHRESLTAAQASDIYALGCILYAMLTLHTPWENSSMTAVHSSVVRNRERPPWPSNNPLLERDDAIQIRQVVEQCWEHEAEKRPTAEQVFSKLVKIKNALTDRTEERLGSTQTSRESDFLTVSRDGGGLHKKDSNRSSEASTAVPFLGNSIDLPSPSSLFQTSSGRSPLIKNDSSSGAEGAQGDLYQTTCNAPMFSESTACARANPSEDVTNAKVSPLTSPEPRSSKRASISSLQGQTQTRPSPSILTTKVHVFSPVTAPIVAPPKHGNEEDNIQLEYSGGSDGEDEDQPQSLYKQSSFGVIQDNPSMLDLALDLPEQSEKESAEVSSDLKKFRETDTRVTDREDPPLNEDDIAYTTAVAAHRIDRQRHAQPDVPPALVNSQSNSLFTSESSRHRLDSSHFGYNSIAEDNIFGSEESAKLRRKRSSQIQAIIEKAGLALLELQRRDELKGSITPSQRRRAARTKAEEDARKDADAKAAAQISRLRHEQRYSEVLSIMEKHADFLRTTKAGVAAIEEGASKQSVYLDLCEEGAIDRLLGAMSRFGKDDSELCQSFCNAICNFSTWSSAPVDHRVRAAGIPSEVVTLMRHHESDVNALAAGCNCLSKIAAASDLSRSAVATLGGPLAVYRAFTRNLATYRDVELARASLRAVRSIANKSEAAAETFVQVAGLDAVSYTAEVFADDCLEHEILGALEAFAFYDRGRRTIITSDGLQALSSIMLRRRDPAFAERCCVFIRSVAQWRDTECENAMLKSSIAERAVMTIRLSEKFPGDEGGRLAFYAAQAVMYLASFGINSRQRLRVAGGLSEVVQLLRTRASNQRVIAMATNSLVELMKGDCEAQAEAERLGAVALLLSAARTYRDDPSVYGVVSLTLGCFAELRDGKLSPSDPLYKYYSGRPVAKGKPAKQKQGNSSSEKKKFPGWKRG